MRVWLVAPFCCLAGAASAQADRPPDWLKRPTAATMRSLWPKEAYRKGLGGEAVLGCIVTVQGALRDCRVLSEDPPGMGFGAAAQVMSAQFLMKPGIKDGRPVETNLRFPVRFQDPQRAYRADDMAATALTNVAWRVAPTFADLVDAYPQKARQEHVSGLVSLQCRYRPEGTLTGCETIREEPAGKGFADAARRMIPKFQAAPLPEDANKFARYIVQMTVAFPVEALDQDQPVIGKPQWRVTPTAETIMEAFPQAARDANVWKARAVVRCVIGEEGALTACRPISEEPPGLGFGAAAAKVGEAARLTVWTSEGLPTVGGTVDAPIRFDLSAIAP